jgi:ATP-dependent Clp protease ATP-binding subunit ClpC
MPKINVYLSDDLAAAVRIAQVPVSAVCQAALERAVRDVTALRGTVNTTADPPAYLPFTRYTNRARKAVELAVVAARRHEHAYVGTEHILLGVLDENENLAVKVLTALDVELDDLRAELVASLGPATSSMPDQLPMTPLAKKALEQATTEATTLGHNYIGCEHLLLGLVATGGVAGEVLARMGVELHTTRPAVLNALIGFMHAQSKLAPSPSAPSPTTTTLEEILRRLDSIEQRLAG